MTSDAILSLHRTTVSYPIKSGPFGRVIGSTAALDAADLELRKGEVLGLLGESGSGKSTLGRVILGLLAPTAGVVRYRGESLADLSTAKRATFRRNAQLIFQDPLSALDPTMNIEQIVTEPLRIQGMVSRSAVRDTARSLLAGVSLNAELATRRPAELSGGQRQRVVIARALSVQPEVVVADEPVSALDVSVQAQILDLLTTLRRSVQLTMLFISHDIAVVRYIADRIAVMYRGVIVEVAPASELVAHPKHPYTRMLMASSPEFGLRDPGANVLEKAVPQAAASDRQGCVFGHRCPYATTQCRSTVPQLRETASGHSTACVLEC
jgi:oligopeptide/dipeptide ABC transporter ATP-binding protein